MQDAYQIDRLHAKCLECGISVIVSRLLLGYVSYTFEAHMALAGIALGEVSIVCIRCCTPRLTDTKEKQ